MPYKVEQEGDKFKVINADTGDVKATHSPPDAQEKAERQVRLLNAIEEDPAFAKKVREENG